MKNKIYSILSGDFSASHYLRIGNNDKLCLYIGKDDNGKFSFDFRGKFKPLRTKSSEVILVSQFEFDDEKCLRFSLENQDLLDCFSIFCEDLITSTSVITDDEIAYQTLRARYFSWKQLFKPNHGNLTEFEIMGLVGELLFLRDMMIPIKGIDAALDSWTGPEKTHKDFSYESEWYEVKTINFGKESVHISSIEQLDGNEQGQLVIYTLERMSPSFDGIRLNALVYDIISSLKSPIHKEIFLAKIELYGFDFSPDNDNYVYDLKKVSKYIVDECQFPRLKRSQLPESIIKVQYDIELSQIEQFKILT